MKRIFLFSLIALSTLGADAQKKRVRANTSEGNWALRMGIGYNNRKVDNASINDLTINRFNISPMVGYFVADNLELGARINFSTSTAKQVITASTNSTTKDNTTGFGVYVMKYFPLNNWFALTGGADLGLGFGNSVLSQTGLADNKSNLTNYGAAVNMGFAFTPVNSFALTADFAGLGVAFNSLDPDGPNNIINTTDFGINAYRNPMNLSLVWYFGQGMWGSKD